MIGITAEDIINSPLFGSRVDAASSLRSFLARIAPASEQSLSAMRSLGLITEDGVIGLEDTGNPKSVPELAEILQQGIKNIPDEEKVRVLVFAFGVDGLYAAAIASGFDLSEEE